MFISQLKKKALFGYDLSQIPFYLFFKCGECDSDCLFQTVLIVFAHSISVIGLSVSI